MGRAHPPSPASPAFSASHGVILRFSCLIAPCPGGHAWPGDGVLPPYAPLARVHAAEIVGARGQGLGGRGPPWQGPERGACGKRTGATDMACKAVALHALASDGRYAAMGFFAGLTAEIGIQTWRASAPGGRGGDRRPIPGGLASHMGRGLRA